MTSWPRVYCAVYGCYNALRRKLLSFFKLPAEDDRRATWLSLICREDLADKPHKHYVVCEEHFETHLILPGKTRKLLKRNALPSLKLPDPTNLNKYIPPPVPRVSQVAATASLRDLLESDSQSPHSQSVTTYTHRKRTLESDPSESRKKIKKSNNDSATEKRQENDVDTLDSESSQSSKSDTQSKRKLESDPSESRKKIKNSNDDSATEKRQENDVETLGSESSQSFKSDTQSKRKLESDPSESRKKVKNSNNDSVTEKRQENDVDTLESESSQSFKSDTQTKRKLESDNLQIRNKVKNSNNDCVTRIIQEKDFHQLCDKFLTEELAELVKAQAYVRLKNSKSVSDHNYKIFCLNLYYTSPLAYRLLQDAISLPNINTLVTSKIPVTTEINDSLLTILKSKVQAMTDKEKICSVAIDAMSLKANLFYNLTQDKIIGFQEIDGVQSPKPANYAMVVMVRGIFIDWKQPVGFALLFDHKNYIEIAKWVDKLLERLLNIGLNIKTFASGMGSDLDTVAKDRLVTVEKPYFFINKRKIYYIFDTPHLLHLVHKSLASYDFHFDDCVATYDHVTAFYVKDKNSRFRLAPKLTTKHILSTTGKKMNVRFSTQLLSNSVATGISTYVDYNVMPESSMDTAELIKLMNNLFDILNSSRAKDNNKYKRAYGGKKFQKIFLNKMLNFFRHLKLIDSNAGKDVTSNVKFIEAFQITIKAILLLFEDLRAEGCTYLFTKRLHQDVLEVFFRQIRKKNGMTDPTSRQFIKTFQTLFISSLKKPPIVGCDTYNLGKFLIHTSALDLPNQKVVNQKIPIIDVEESIARKVQIRRSEYNRLEVPKKNSLIYICSFLLTRCAERHRNCPILRAYMHPDPICLEFAYLKYKNYIKQGGRRLKAKPADAFLQYVEEMKEVFHNYIQKEHTNGKFSEAMYKEIDEIFFLEPCPCFPSTYLKKLFIRMRIFQTLKLINRLIKVQ